MNDPIREDVTCESLDVTAYFAAVLDQYCIHLYSLPCDVCLTWYLTTIWSLYGGILRYY